MDSQNNQNSRHYIHYELFLNAYHSILMEAYAKKNRPRYFSEEGLALAGLKWNLIPYTVVLKQINKRDNIDTERKSNFCVKNQRLNMPVHKISRKKWKTDNNRKIDIHQQQQCFTFPYDSLLVNPYDQTDQQPNSRKQQFKSRKRYFKHSVHPL